MIDDIGVIYYIATSTEVHDGIAIAGTYHAPILLYVFIVTLVMLCLDIFQLFLISRK